MGRVGRILAWVIGILLGVPLLLVALIMLVGNIPPGRRLIEHLATSVTSGEVHVAGLHGFFPDHLRAATVQIDDTRGPYLTLHDVVCDWSAWALLHKTVDINHLDAASADFIRKPLPSTSKSTSSGLPVKLVLHEFHVDRLTIAPAVAGKTYQVALHGSADMRTLTTGRFDLAVAQLGGTGHYAVAGDIGAQHLSLTASAHEQAHGLISGLAKLPDLGPIAIEAKLDGPRNAVATSLVASAGPLHAQVAGTLNLVHDAADLTVAATAPAMKPAPDVSWQDVDVHAQVQGPFKRPELSGHVRIDALKAVGAGIGRLTAALSGNQGTAHVQAALDGLTLPGQDPSLFAAAPVLLNATVDLAAPDRPVNFTLQHPLVQAQGSARTAGPLSAHVVLTLPTLEQVAAAAGAHVQGHTSLTLDVSRHAATTDVALRGILAITGGQKQAEALLGNTAKLDLAASLTGHAATLSRLQVTGRSVDVAAHGSLGNGRASLDWTAAVTDLAAVDPTLTGRIAGSGSVSGPEQDLTASADLHGNVGAQGVKSGPITVHLAAQGLPHDPSGTVTAQGALLNAPVDLAVAVTRQNGGIQVAVQRADWKSLQAGGTLTLPAGAKVPLGDLHLRMTQLSDLAPLLHRSLAGSIDAALNSTQAAAKLTMTAQGLAIPGTARVARAKLDATVDHPTDNPAIQASLAVDGVSAGSVTGASAKLQAHGTQAAVAVTVAATAPELAGSAARLNAAATVNVPARSVALSSLQADWKQQTLRLLQPATLDLGQGGGAIDHLRLGLRDAVLAVKGRISPKLDLTASLRNLPADLAAVAMPSVKASGTISAEAHLTGTLSQPDGTIRLTGLELRDRSGTGVALPPADLRADATLHGRSAKLDVRLTMAASHFAVTGTAPLAMTGPLDLRTTGTLNLVLLDPILTAEGRRVRGTLALDAAVAGTPEAPRITGTARLTGGDAQDYAMGVHITDIDALLQADGDTLRLVRFSGRAGTGTIGASGTIALKAPMPVDMTLTATNARLLASPLVTATIGAHLTARGAVEGNLAVAGTLRVQQANVQIPSKLPSSVAVIPVRVAGAPAAHPAKPGARPEHLAAGQAGPPGAAAAPAPTHNVALDITLDAPDKVFIRGRGINVEFGGKVQVRGTADHPLPSGGLNLIRGQMSLVGQTLTFTSGSVDFIGAGLTDPGIHLVATSTTPTMTATLTVSGTAKDPKLTLSSVPQLPQDQILSQLLFHQGEGSLSPFQVAEIAAGLAELSGETSGVGGPLDKLRNALGLDELTVGSNAAGNPTLEAGRYVAPGVYLGAQQAASGTGTQATLQVNLAKGLKLETSAGTATATATGAASSGQAASVGLTYQFQY